MTTLPLRACRLARCFLLLLASRGFTADGSPPQVDRPAALYRKPRPSELREAEMRRKLAEPPAPSGLPPLGPTPCVGGFAGPYPCSNIDLEYYLPAADIGAGEISVVWGWRDSLTGREFALLAHSLGTSFIEVTDPQAPVYLGILPTSAAAYVWRDVKVHLDHAFIVADLSAGHGMQVFDLSQLRAVASPPVTFVETAHYGLMEEGHTLALNEETGFAYVVGGDTCGGGWHIVDVRVPTAPAFVGCYDGDGYVHETQCVIYGGPDAAHQGREICFGYNADTLTLLDVTDKVAPIQVSRTSYPLVGYTHQGWLTEDHRYLLMNDELDEIGNDAPTTTHLWDVADLDAPRYIGAHVHATATVDHNLYILGNLVFESNYTSGLHVLETCCVGQGSLREVGTFDVVPGNDDRNFGGTWCNYPYFRSGAVAVSSRHDGLFLLRPSFGQPTCPATGLDLPDVGNELRAMRGAADVRLEVGFAPPSQGGFNLHRTSDRTLAGLLPLGGWPSTDTSSFADGGVIGDGSSYYYQARTVGGCGDERP